MSEKKRKVFSGEYKAKVALEAVRGGQYVGPLAFAVIRQGRHFNGDLVPVPAV